MSLFELTTEIKRKESELSQLKESLKVVARKILFSNYYN
jgi:hypothetical protein